MKDLENLLLKEIAAETTTCSVTLLCLSKILKFIDDYRVRHAQEGNM